MPCTIGYVCIQSTIIPATIQIPTNTPLYCQNKKGDERQTYNFPPLRLALLSESLPDAALDTRVDNDCGSTAPFVAMALWRLASGFTDDPELMEVGEGVLREGIDVGVADESSMRPVVGTAGPSHQLNLRW